ncbi:hypothetical protein AVEN_230983-1 [Araneus ventricosus]|uniref:Reverse transcriptase domain-containing protein n=1 Tax=Araneus ventricosus TaxID=182803 RepID=A0A4Y2A2S1_ARAVE|nr:hypothetical protein AVEN_230983-1 [Araneus ventricosus]
MGELDRDVKMHIAVKQGETWYRPQMLGREYDLYLDTKGKGFSKNKWVASEYKELINDQLERGVIEECERDKKEYLIPHRAVVRKDKKKTKVRVVFNCSSKSRGNFSLDDCLETGPNLNPNVLDVILNFCKFKIVFKADIEKAFVMIGISESGRKDLKFLWYSDKPNKV